MVQGSDVIHSKNVVLQAQQELNIRRSWLLTMILGRKPWFPPCSVPLDLLFFRRVFSNLRKLYGNDKPEVPLFAFQRAFVRLHRVLGITDKFDAEELDVDKSSAVGWYEFVGSWQRSRTTLRLSCWERVFITMEDPAVCIFGQLVNFIIMTLIFLSCVNFILATTRPMKEIRCAGCAPVPLRIFDDVEGISVAVFTVEYLVRVSTAPFTRTELLDYEEIMTMICAQEWVTPRSSAGRLFRFLIHPMNVIDVLVIAPYYAERLLGMVVANLAVLRLTRLLRLLKLGSSVEVITIIFRVFQKSMNMFNVMSVYLVLGVCFSSAAMYYAEGGDWDPQRQDYFRVSHDGEESESPYQSIVHAFWWCIVTFTTVGYGDVYPVTVLGKLIAVATMLIGILVLAMPISVISMNFDEVWNAWIEERRLKNEGDREDAFFVQEALQTMTTRYLLLIELFDENKGEDEPECLGEARYADLPINSDVRRTDELLLPLRATSGLNTVHGCLHAAYEWRPHTLAMGDKKDMIKGVLEVRVRRAEGIKKSDWKKSGLRDLYAVVHCWPRPPKRIEVDGVQSQKFKTRTICGSLQPAWEECKAFDFNWPQNWVPAFQHNSLRQDHSPKAQKGDIVHHPAWVSASAWSSSTAIQDVPEDRSLRNELHRQRLELQRLSGQVSELCSLMRDRGHSWSATSAPGDSAADLAYSNISSREPPWPDLCTEDYLPEIPGVLQV